MAYNNGVLIVRNTRTFGPDPAVRLTMGRPEQPRGKHHRDCEDPKRVAMRANRKRAPQASPWADDPRRAGGGRAA